MTSYRAKKHIMNVRSENKRLNNKRLNKSKNLSNMAYIRVCCGYSYKDYDGLKLCKHYKLSTDHNLYEYLTYETSECCSKDAYINAAFLKFGKLGYTKISLEG